MPAKLFSFARAPAEGDTRMTGPRNLSVPHAPLAVGLAESKCSPVLCTVKVNGDG